MIIGSGLAGIQLSLSILKEDQLNDKEIILIDPLGGQKKTWCFWEQGNGQWDHLLYKKWDQGSFIDKNGPQGLDMGSYCYKMIRSEDLKAHFNGLIKGINRIKIIQGEVVDVNIEQSLAITDQEHISAKYIFDSRFNKAELKGIKEPTVSQHFKGWFIKTKEDIFDPKQFTMMDFSSSPDDECSFMYILPFSKNEALLEFTFFSPNVKREQVYDDLIKKYIDSHFSSLEYEILETEMGIIPMSSYNFSDLNSKNYCRIGTAGGWVKASSGYSFKMTEKKVPIVIQNLINQDPLDKGLFKSRFQFYDRIFLSILENENSLGNGIFQEMYSKNPCHSIFKFLDEDSKIIEDLKIISSFNPSPFLRAVRRELF